MHGERKSIVLVDILFHAHETAGLEARRYSIALRSDITRRILLEELGLEPYCAAVHQKCLVHVNRHLLSLADHTLTELHHGDYVRIDVPPHPGMQVPTQTIACCLRDGHSLHEIPGIYEAADSPLEWIPIPQADDSDDDHSLLQQPPRCLTAENVAHTQRPGLRPVPISLAPSSTMVDISAVQWMIHEVQQIPLDIWDHWPADFQLPEVTQQRLATCGA